MLVKCPPFSLDLVVETGAENFILRVEIGTQDFLKDAPTPKSLHFKVLAFNLFCTHGTTHGVTMVFGIRSGSCIAYWVLCRTNIEMCVERVLFGCLIEIGGNM